MKDVLRRIARLESGRAHSGGVSVDAQTCVAAHAKLSEFLDAVTAKKAAGDVHGVAGRQIAEFLAAVERQA